MTVQKPLRITVCTFMGVVWGDLLQVQRVIKKHAFLPKFNPSLVSVAGTYCLRDAIPSEMIDQAVQVTYDEAQGLVFTLLKPAISTNFWIILSK